MVHLNPEERPNISEILDNSWLSNWPNQTLSLIFQAPTPHLYLIDILYFFIWTSFYFILSNFKY